MNSDLTPEAEREALEAMLHSEGWRIYLAHVAHAWGPEAFEIALDRVLGDADAGAAGELTARLRDTFKGVRAEVTWPDARVRALRGGVETPRPFAVHRRI